MFLINVAIAVFVPTVGIYFIVEFSNPVPLLLALLCCGTTNWNFLKGSMSDPGYLVRCTPPLAHAPANFVEAGLEGIKFDPVRFVRR